MKISLFDFVSRPSESGKRGELLVESQNVVGTWVFEHTMAVHAHDGELRAVPQRCGTSWKLGILMVGFSSFFVIELTWL